MILRNKRFDSIQNKILVDLYNRLLNRKKRVVFEETKLRESMVRLLCEVNFEDDLDRILKGIEPLLRKKRRASLLMGGNYEEGNKDTKEAIVKFMASMPKVTVQPKYASPIYL